MRRLPCLAVVLMLATAGATAGQVTRPQGQAPVPPPNVAALDALAGRPIVEIRLAIDGAVVSDDDLRAVLETEVGAPFATAAVRESIVHLMALARFEDVRVEAASSARGVSLTFHLATLHTVKAIEFRGDIGLPVGQLRRAVEDRYTSSPAISRAEEIAAMLEGLYRDHGFLKATVSAGTEPGGRPDRVLLVFTMHAGPPARVGKAQVDGAPAGASADVIRRLGLQPGSRFDRPALDAAMTRYVQELRADGFLQAKVDPDYAYSSNQELVDVTIRMSRGPRVVISFRGDPLPDKRREAILALLRDGLLDEDVLENEERSIEDEFRARGFRDATAPFQPDRVSDDQLQITFTVTRGPQYKVASVEITGNQQVSRAEILPVLRVTPGQWYVKALVDADAKTLQESYRKQGFRAAKVSAASGPVAGEPAQIAVRLDVNEGPRTTIAGIEFEKVAVLPRSALQQAIESRVGGPYYAPQVEADREAVLYEYQSRGYQQATVTVPDGLSQDGTRFQLRFVIDEGPQSLIDHVLVVGNARTKTETIERALNLKRGMPLSAVELTEAQRRVSALGLFRRVQLTPLERNTDNRRDLLVVVEEAPVNTIAYGGGLEGAHRLRTNATTNQPEEVFDLAPRGFFEIGRRNLWGKNRSVSLFLRGAIRSSDQFNDTASTTTTLEDTTSGFREYRALASYREPRFLDLPVDVLVTGGVDQAIRSTFDFNQKRILVEGSHRFGPSFSLAGRYSFGHTRLFNERIDPDSKLPVDRLFPRVRLSELSASAVLNTRDDAFDPTRGYLSAFDLTFAPRAIGSEVGFIKGSWQGFLYKQLPKAKGVVLAGGVRLGVANGFPQVVVNSEGQIVVLDQELPASERFFAGGDSTVRGFALDRLGASAVLDANGVSNGGNGLLIFNGELRFPVWAKRSLGGAVFIDAGNVFEKAGDIDLGSLRSGAGFGLRWKSPVGPLRVDFAWKLHPITFSGGTKESQFAWYVTIGQAF